MARTLLFIDTNILLDFYRAPQSDLSLEVFDKLLEHSSTLIISEQVEIEFNNNRKRVIDEYIKHIPTKIDNIALAPVLLSNTVEAQKIKTEVENLTKDFEKLKKNLCSILDSPNEKDKAYQKIIPFFNVNTAFSYKKTDIELQDQIFLKAIKRFHRGMPPRKKNDLYIGDALNWEWCLHCCTKDEKANLIILSRDDDFSESPKRHDNPINKVLEDEFKSRVGDEFYVKLERSLTKALNDIQISLTEEQADELDEIQKISDDFEYEVRNGECHLCGSLAMFDAYCNKCGALVLGDADGDNYSVNDDKIYEFDFNCNENVIHCPKCNNTKMDIEFADYCGYCQYKLDEAFDED